MRKPKRLIKLEAEAKAKGVSVQKLLEDDLEKHLGKFASIREKMKKVTRPQEI